MLTHPAGLNELRQRILDNNRCRRANRAHSRPVTNQHTNAASRRLTARLRGVGYQASSAGASDACKPR